MKTVTKAADIVGLTVRMIQEYEKYGVAIKPTERNKYGYLMYDDDAIDRLWQIRFYRELGYDKKAIKAVFDDPCYDFSTTLETQVKQLEQKRQEIDNLINIANLMKETGLTPKALHSQAAMMGATFNDTFGVLGAVTRQFANDETKPGDCPITDEEFEHMRKTDALLESAGYVGHYYGTPKAYVEEQLEAGKDVILRSGMLGGNKASVKTKGSITAKFFEFTNIECDGDIQADVLMDCDVMCQGKVSMTGARGSIIGGTLHAIQGVEVTSLGNDAEKKTEIMVGAGADVASRLRVLEKKIEATETNLQKIEGGLKQFDMLEAERGVSYANDPRRMQLLRIKIRDTATLANDKEESKKLRRLVEGSRGACVSVLQEVYPGVIIRIGDLRFDLRNVGKSIEFYRLSDKISTRPCYQGVE